MVFVACVFSKDLLGLENEIYSLVYSCPKQGRKPVVWLEHSHPIFANDNIPVI